MLPNPFDLTGPEFLVFFIALSTVVGAGMMWLRDSGEQTDESGDIRPTDPYELAYLMGGRPHLLRVAVLSLIDRRLIEASGSDLKAMDPENVRRAERPLDRAILQCFLTSDASSQLFVDANIRDQADEIGNKLRAEGLLPDNWQTVRRRNILIGATLLVLGVGIVKLLVALSRGKTNVIFLVILCVIVPIVFTLLSNPLRTPRGSRILARMQGMLGDLRYRKDTLRLHEVTDDIVLLAAVFGITALPVEAAALMGSVRLRPSRDTAWAGSACGGSSCGASSCGGGGSSCSGGGSSCSGGGSSCGGGGCGGGCGGCGGG